IALLAILLFDPLMAKGIGFQFSFATTAAILLLFSSCDVAMQMIFNKRPLSQITKMDRTNQHGYFLLSTIRQGLALTLAVNLVALPMTLFYFHKFPWMSLIYNLFFPFLVSVSMLLLIIGTLSQLLFSPLGEWVHACNNVYTHYMLNYTYNMPTSVD